MKRSIMARVYSFDIGVLMLRNISAPLLNALDVDPGSTLSDSCSVDCLPVTGETNSSSFYPGSLLGDKTAHS